MSISDSEDDWFNRDLESFSVEVPDDEAALGIEVPLLSREKLLEMQKTDGSNGGSYQIPANKRQNKGKSKSNSGAADEKFTQKLPITKLATIAGLSMYKSCVEAFIFEEELLETLRVKLSERYLELSLKILENIFASPFEEHKKRFFEKVAGIESFSKKKSVKKFLQTTEDVELKVSRSLLDTFPYY